MHLSINIIGDAFADVYCYLEGGMPSRGGVVRLLQPMHTVAGGSALNTATHLSSLLCDFWRKETGECLRTANVNLQTVINENDEYGRLLASHCRRHDFRLINRRVSNQPSCFFGTDDAALRSQEGDKSTGHCAAIVSEGDRSFLSHPGCMDDFQGSHILTNFDDLDPSASSAKLQHVHVAGYYNIAGFWNGELSRKLAEIREIQARKNQRTTISLVPQHDATEEWDGGLLDTLQYIDFLILSDEEAKNITKYQCGAAHEWNGAEFLKHVVEFFCRNLQTIVIVTLGSKGAVVLHKGEIIHKQKTLPEEDPRDPTGAGDAFAAGFLHGFLSYQAESRVEHDLSVDAVKAGVQWGCATGTCSVMTQGASVPSKKDVIKRKLVTITS